MIRYESSENSLKNPSKTIIIKKPFYFFVVNQNASGAKNFGGIKTG